ncbi:hypothetical protein HY522_06665 [bacterium]|nr:hypothetical protein [bacterium]
MPALESAARLIPAKICDVAVLHDDTESLKDTEGSEAHIAVWETIHAVEETLGRLGHRHSRISLGAGVSPVLSRLQSSPPDIVFHLAETAFGETLGEARVTGMLELLGIPHTSTSPAALLLCRDKLKTKAVLQERGIPTPPHAVSFDGTLPEILPPPPWISKPSLEDGSMGVMADAVTSDPAALRARVAALYRAYNQTILIETYLNGREFHFGVVAGEILPLVEIDFSDFPSSASRIIGYESKWLYDTVYCKSARTVCPAPVDPSLRDRISTLGMAALRALGVDGYARLDFRTDPDNRIYLLDVNPNPDLSPLAGMAKMADAAGWGFDGLVDRILNYALRSRRS